MSARTVAVDAAVGAEVEAVIADRGLEVADVAARVGMPTRRLRKLLRGKGTWHLGTVIRAGRVLCEDDGEHFMAVGDAAMRSAGGVR